MTRGMSLGGFPPGLNSIVKPVLAMALFALSSVANAVTVILVSHNQTSTGGTISTLITDGSHTSGIAGPTTAIWDWDGTSLTSTGLYSQVGSIGGSPFSATILSDQITNLSIDTSTGTGSAATFACIEGTFLSTVGASGCGGHNLGANFVNDSTTTWGPGTATSQTIGGDDVLTAGGPRDITSYDFDTVSFNGNGLHVGDEVLIGNGIALGVGLPVGGELLTFSFARAAIDDAVSTSPDQLVNIQVLANDILDDGAGEDIVNLQSPAGTAPQNGTVVVTGAKPGPRSGLSIEYTPDMGFIGTDTFNYTVTDQSGAGTATVTVTVTDQVSAVDDGTQAAPFGSVLVGQTISLDVLANDTGLSATPLTVMAPVTAVPTLGVATVTGSPGDAGTIRISFSAGPDAGLDSFGYQLSDTNGSTDEATVLVEILPLNTPVAVDDTATLAAEEENSDDVPDNFITVLDNDGGLVDTPLEVTITRDAANGFVGPIQNCSLVATCRVWYRPDAGFVGLDNFRYTVTDSTDETSSEATVTITVIERPSAVSDEVSTPENQSVLIDVLGNDSGLANTPLSVTTTSPSNGTVAVTGSPGDRDTIRIKYTPSGNGAKTDSFTYTVTDTVTADNGDDKSKTSFAKVTVNITNVQSQDTVPGKTSAMGPVGLGLMMLLSWLKGRRRGLPGE